MDPYWPGRTGSIATRTQGRASVAARAVLALAVGNLLVAIVALATISPQPGECLAATAGGCAHQGRSRGRIGRLGQFVGQR
jgi:hypothetical protein